MTSVEIQVKMDKILEQLALPEEMASGANSLRYAQKQELIRSYNFLKAELAELQGATTSITTYGVVERSS